MLDKSLDVQNPGFGKLLSPPKLTAPPRQMVKRTRKTRILQLVQECVSTGIANEQGLC